MLNEVKPPSKHVDSAVKLSQGDKLIRAREGTTDKQDKSENMTEEAWAWKAKKDKTDKTDKK